MVSQIPLSRKSVPRNSTFASFVCAKIGLITVAVHGMCLTFMAQEASSRGESGILTKLRPCTGMASGESQRICYVIKG